MRSVREIAAGSFINKCPRSRYEILRIAGKSHAGEKIRHKHKYGEQSYHTRLDVIDNVFATADRFDRFKNKVRYIKQKSDNRDEVDSSAFGRAESKRQQR